MDLDFEALRAQVMAQCHGDIYSIHGPSHWKRVEQNGIILASRTGANVEVVRLFALFHDSKRISDLVDDGHGARGAEYAAKLRGSWFHLDDQAFALLHYACVWHTDQEFSADATIGTCWDADRLDLGRVGIIPHEDYLSTAFGKEVARMGSFQPFLEKK
jgi:uncharacterized protein